EEQTMTYSRQEQMQPVGGPCAEANESLLVDETTRGTLEAIADAEGRVVSRLVEAILRANLAHDRGRAAGELSGDNPGDQWAQLTNEIMHLENIRNAAIALAVNQADQN